MKAISLWQPWATLMALGLKKIETRHWSTRYRGPLLIHAAKKIVPDPNWHVFYAIEKAGLRILELPRGCLLCKLDLMDCKRIELDDRFESPELFYGDFTPGRYIWITENVTAFDPIPYRGSQGFFEVPNKIANQQFNPD